MDRKIEDRRPRAGQEDKASREGHVEKGQCAEPEGDIETARLVRRRFRLTRSAVRLNWCAGM